MEKDWCFLLGNIRGNPELIRNFYEKNKEHFQLDTGNNHIILLGDVGANYALQGQQDARFKKALSKYPFTYVCLRGNHEARVQKVMEMHPEKWEAKKKYGGEIYVEKKFPRIEYLSDGPAVYEFDGYKTFSLPGAYSVDKWYRLNHGWAWFEDEQLSEEEMNTGRKIKEVEPEIDLVISHTCPISYEPRDLFLPYISQETVDKRMEQYLGEIEEGLSYKRWVFGHFHADRLYPWKDGRQMLMLFNRSVVDLQKFMHMTEKDGLQDILA